MTDYFLGADLGGTKTRVMIADSAGSVVGFGEGGPGNHESIGYRGAKTSLQTAAAAAFSSAGLKPDQICGSGFGVAGYDWPNEKQPTFDVINSLGLGGRIELVNDVELGILAGSPRLWGVAVVSGTGCNCRGWDEQRTRFGRVTGGGTEFGEGAGAGELIFKTCAALGRAYTGAGPATALAEEFCKRTGCADLAELLQELICRNIELDASDAPLVFEVARKGDPVAVEIVRWAGRELGIMASAVIRQLGFESIDFDLVQIGSMFDGSPLLTEEMKNVVHEHAPHANFIRLQEPPVLGAVLLGMQAAGRNSFTGERAELVATLPEFLKRSPMR
jgi:N-acetylglucosamine kinase-like BadF-type ATPase